jgi:hypothetical protein
MKLATIALASLFALSSTFALAETRHNTTSHHKYTSSHKYKSAVRPYQGTVGMGRYGGSPNDRGCLVGGSDPGTYKP